MKMGLGIWRVLGPKGVIVLLKEKNKAEGEGRHAGLDGYGPDRPNFLNFAKSLIRVNEGN